MTPALRSIAHELLRARRTRDAVFAAYLDGFGEPAWDILLFLASQDQPDVDQAAVIVAVGARRENADLFLRWAGTQDLVLWEGQRVRMSARARALMTSYLEQLSLGRSTADTGGKH